MMDDIRKFDYFSKVGFTISDTPNYEYARIHFQNIGANVAYYLKIILNNATKFTGSSIGRMSVHWYPL